MIKYTLTTCTLTNNASTMHTLINYIQRHTPGLAIMWISNCVYNRLQEGSVDTTVAFMGFLKREEIYEIATFCELTKMTHNACLLCWYFSFFLTKMLLKPTDSCLHVGNINPLHTRKPGLILQSL